MSEPSSTLGKLLMNDSKVELSVATAEAASIAGNRAIAAEG